MRKAEEALVLVLLYAPGPTGQYAEPIEGRTRIMKEIFLLDEEGTSEDPLLHSGLPFIAYKYGPFSKKVAAAVSTLTNEGRLEVLGVAEPYRYRLSAKGAEEARQHWERLATDAKKAVFAIKARYNGQPLESLLQYVYRKYPEYTVESEIRERLMDAA